MSDILIITVIIGLVILVYLVLKPPSVEDFALEYTNRVNEKTTIGNEISSYRQETNHIKPTHPPYENPEGMETPFRVNQFNSFMKV